MPIRFVTLKCMGKDSTLTWLAVHKDSNLPVLLSSCDRSCIWEEHERGNGSKAYRSIAIEENGNECWLYGDAKTGKVSLCTTTTLKSDTGSLWKIHEKEKLNLMLACQGEPKDKIWLDGLTASAEGTVVLRPTLNVKKRSGAKWKISEASSVDEVQLKPDTSSSDARTPGDQMVASDAEAKSVELDGMRRPADSPELEEASLRGQFTSSELVVGLVGAVGTDLSRVAQEIQERLEPAGYTVERIKVSEHVIRMLAEVPVDFSNLYDRTSSMMDAGNSIRERYNEKSIMALGVASCIQTLRKRKVGEGKLRRKTAYIVDSLKRPEEVAQLRSIYGPGFYLFGVHCEEKRRLDNLLDDKNNIDEDRARLLMKRDQIEQSDYGQRTAKTFHLSDFFIRIDENNDQLKNCVRRMIDLIMGDPYITPSFGEHAMYLAYTAALRSADLSRQVGAVIAREREILSTGANDCPRFGGGLYWPEFNHEEKMYEDDPDGRDLTRGKDSNRTELLGMISSIMGKIEFEIDTAMENNAPELKSKEKFRSDLLSQCQVVLEKSRIGDITEYGRVVHAEMEALLACARRALSTLGATLYCTTFPCHNCAKHIVASGILRVVYIEPYPKSLASDLHGDSIHMGFRKKTDDPVKNKKVYFEPFVGVGPRRFFDLFSMTLGSGYEIRRKNNDGIKEDWDIHSGRMRVPMLPYSYLDLEVAASRIIDKLLSNQEVSDVVT